jgi:acylphosphatase
VQGVGFRYWVRDQAVARGLAGSATNLRDGRVEVIAQGPRALCEALLDDLLGGAAPGYVTDVASRWADVDDVGIGFRVLSR